MLGYYLDISDWDSAMSLFARSATVEVDGSGVYVGPTRIRAFLSLSAPDGPVRGHLRDALQKAASH